MDSPGSAVRELSEIGRVGQLDLVFGLKAGRTMIRHSFCEIPHKITRLYHPENSTLAQLILMNSTAGLFPGDRVEMRITVERGARVLLTSQASTKVHPGMGVADLALKLSVESGGELHFYNDPLIPFRGSRLRQRTIVEIATDSCLSFWDGFMAGRVNRGEAWEFDEIDSASRVTRDGNLIYLERYRLNPGMKSLNSQPAYVGTGLFHGAAPPEPSQNLGVNECAPGFHVVRALAHSGTEYHRMQASALRSVFQQRGERVPDLRKM